MTPTTIAVGSTNPVKVTAVRQTVARIWPTATVVAAAVSSGVSEMPLSDAESLRGARQRARAALDRLEADLGVGLEGGVSEGESGLMLHGWVAVVDGNGREGIGCAGRLPLPAAIAARIRDGEELGLVMDEILNTRHVSQKGGTIGALTAGLVSRRDAFAHAVAYALAPFVASHLYDPA